MRWKLLVLVAVAASCRKPAQRALPEGHRERRLDKGRIVIYEAVDSRYPAPMTTVVVLDEKAKERLSALLSAIYPDLQGPYDKENFDGTLNLAIGIDIDTEILTLDEYKTSLVGLSLHARRDYETARRELREHDAVVYRSFAPKDAWGRWQRRPR